MCLDGFGRNMHILRVSLGAQLDGYWVGEVVASSRITYVVLCAACPEPRLH